MSEVVLSGNALRITPQRLDVTKWLLIINQGTYPLCRGSVTALSSDLGYHNNDQNSTLSSSVSQTEEVSVFKTIHRLYSDLKANA